MADYTAADLLTACNNAIYALLSGRVSSYSINGRTFTYQNLKDLLAIRSALQSEKEALEGTYLDFTLAEWGDET